MKVIGITGGVASGKTTTTNFLRVLLQAPVFDADQAAREILEQPRVLEQVELTFGRQFRSATGAPDRVKIREVAFESVENRKRLEAIIHPRVLNLMVEKIDAARMIGSCNWFIIDIPLLFEVGVEAHCDSIVVVACTRSTQKHRLISYRGIDPAVADQMIAAQLPLEGKMHKAHFIIWSECKPAVLERQVEALAQRMKELLNV